LPAFVAGTNYFAVFPDGQPSAPGIDDGGQPYGEAMLDVEYAHGIAPGASIVLYAGDAGNSAPAPAQTLVDTVSAAVADTTHHCASIAISWAQCGEPASFYQNLDTIFARGASEGQSIFVATGDVGTAAPSPGSCTFPPKPAKPNILENAGSPNVTAVGASMFTAAYDSNGNVTSTLANTKQNVWKFARVSKKIPFLAAAGASTGGYSSIFARPIYQSGVAGITGTKRAVPDIVLGGGNLGGTATVTEKGNSIVITGNIGPAPNFWECFDSGLVAGSGVTRGYECQTTGGTSIVPPQFAGIFAIAAQKGGKLQGLINPQLYAMAKANLKTPSAVGLVDITTGTNAYAPVAGKPAKKGFDLASGWGSIDINQFVTSFITFVPPAPKPTK
jgi:subtilase family serine protease